MAVRILLAAVSFFFLPGALTKVIVVSTTVVLRHAYTEFHVAQYTSRVHSAFDSRENDWGHICPRSSAHPIGPSDRIWRLFNENMHACFYQGASSVASSRVWSHPL
jgi:hypothetical protein